MMDIIYIYIYIYIILYTNYTTIKIKEEHRGSKISYQERKDKSKNFNIEVP